MRVFRQLTTEYFLAGKRVKPGTPGAVKRQRRSRKWYVEYRDHTGTLKRVPGTHDKRSTQQLGAKLEQQRAVDIADPFAAHRRRPLVEHLEEFRLALEGKGNSANYVAMVAGRIGCISRACGWKCLADLDAVEAAAWFARRQPADPNVEPEAMTPRQLAQSLGISLAAIREAVQRHQLAATGQGRARMLPKETVQSLIDLRRRDVSPQTRNYYRCHLRAFGNWLVRHRRLPDNPFRLLDRERVTDKRHERRELTAKELTVLLSCTRASKRMFRGLSGYDRAMLYATAAGTGFRASALASLAPVNLDLEGDVPTITLAARAAKNRKTTIQPIPADLAASLREYADGMAPSQTLWPGTWASANRGAAMLRLDLEAAGIPYVVAGPEGPLYVDFHALRHTYLTLLGRSGVDLRTAQELAGHSTPLLTARYSHCRLHDLAGAVECLPRIFGDLVTVRVTGNVHHSGSFESIPDHPEGVQHQTKNPEKTGELTVFSGSHASEGDGTRTRNHRIDNGKPCTHNINRTIVLGQNTAQVTGGVTVLDQVTAAWDGLPDHVQQAILMLAVGKKAG